MRSVAPLENGLSLQAPLCDTVLRAAGYTGSVTAPASVRSATPGARVRFEGLDGYEFGRFRAPRTVAAPGSRG